MLRTLPVAVALAIALLAPGRASAGGFEFAAAGTRPLGRGGAFAARADDPMAIVYNPAMLADLPDTQLMLNSHVVLWDACVQRVGTYGDHASSPGETHRFGGPSGVDDTWLSERFPRVCNSGRPGPVPALLASIRLLPELGLAFGITAPSGLDNSRWDDDGGVQTAGGLRPSPLRYALSEQDVVLFHPSVGVGYRPVDWIRIGLTFQWGIAIVRSVSFASTEGNEHPFYDLRTELQANDFFVPAGILSVHLRPHPNFDVMLSGRISDAVGGATEAGGHLAVTANYFSTDPELPPAPNRVENVQLRAGQPWTFALGLRYADRIRPRSWERGFEAAVRGVVDDAMYSEHFDVELDLVYEMNSQVGDYVITLPAGATVCVENCQPGAPGAPLRVPLPVRQPSPRGWSDTLAIRVGGDWNVVPGTFAARAGFHTEFPLAQSRYMIQDNIQSVRIGFHLGATLRIERFDISFAYAHIVQLETTIDDANFRQVAASAMQGQCEGAPDYDPGRPVASRGCYPSGFGPVVNAGTYSGSFNVFSLGASYHFE
jgi:long-chain fatty acid transport protein